MKAVPAVVAVSAGVAAVLLGWWWLGDDDGTQPAANQPAANQQPEEASGTVTVLAAASLTEAFDELADRLAEDYPDLDITYSFGPSSSLAQQVVSGAPADVLVTANTTTMDIAVQADAVAGDPEIIARNTLTLVTPADDPGDVRGLADLAREELRIAICEPQVPCGAAAEELLTKSGIDATPDTLATDVKEALALVTLGEADAALVYQTDAVAAGDAVRSVPLDDDSAATAEGVVNDYPAALLADAPNPEAARVFMDAMTGEPGRSALEAAGFVEP